MHMDVQVSREHRDVRSDLSLRQIKIGAIRPLSLFVVRKIGFGPSILDKLGSTGA